MEGQTQGPGWKLLELLTIAGWSVAVMRGFGGGVLVRASKNGLEVMKSGASVAEIGLEVFEEAVRVQRLSRLTHVQLELDVARTG